MAKLYELTDEYRELMDAFDSGELTDAECGDRLRQLDGEINQKVLGLARMVKNLLAELDGVEKERKRLQSREKTIKSHLDGVKSYMKYNLELAGTTKIRDDIITVQIRSTGGAVEVIDEDEIPRDYKIPQPETIDRESILKLLKSGVGVPGCSLRIGTALTIS